MRPLTPGIVAAWVLVALLGFGPPLALPDISLPWLPSITRTATAATYIYEKDQHAIPNGVLVALDKLNRERKITATAFEQDTKDGSGDTPEPYKIPLAAAKTAGLPAIVVTANQSVLRVVKDPKSEAEVMEAAR